MLSILINYYRSMVTLFNVSYITALMPAAEPRGDAIMEAAEPRGDAVPRSIQEPLELSGVREARSAAVLGEARSVAVIPLALLGDPGAVPNDAVPNAAVPNTAVPNAAAARDPDVAGAACDAPLGALPRGDPFTVVPLAEVAGCAAVLGALPRGDPFTMLPLVEAMEAAG